MTIKSMTGFGRAEGAYGDSSWHWEVRSVNGRGLDVRLRLAPGFESLEPQVRAAIAKRAVRGSISASLSAEHVAGNVEVRLNEAALEQVLKAADKIHQLTGCERSRAEGLLALKGVLEIAERSESEAERDARRATVLASLDEALDDLSNARGAEGAHLETVLRQQIADIEQLVATVESSPARTPQAIEARLADQIARLLGNAQGLDPQRLHQEAVLLATRADVEEEIKRLRAHIAAFRELLGEPGAVGRKLDFLAQEFNREANTICSKSNDVVITRAGLGLKAVIDQMREQVQNIE